MSVEEPFVVKGSFSVLLAQTLKKRMHTIDHKGQTRPYPYNNLPKLKTAYKRLYKLLQANGVCGGKDNHPRCYRMTKIFSFSQQISLTQTRLHDMINITLHNTILGGKNM